ncbi:MAG: VCBS repeat-containing protein [Planctomycetota bacterium]
MLDRKDPSLDGWDTEVINDVAGKQLKKLGELLSAPEAINDNVLSDLALVSVAVSPLRPIELKNGFADESIEVLVDAEADASPAASVGLEALAQAIAGLAEPFAGSRRVHYKFKVIRVRLDGDSCETEAYFQADAAAGANDDGPIVQQNATWTCRWDLTPSPDMRGRPELRLASITARDFREAVGPASGRPLFEDVTAAVLCGNESFQAQVMKGTNYWRSRLQKSLGIDVFGHQGMALGDANGDGLDDIYLCQPGGVPNRLFLQQADCSAVDATASSGLGVLDRSRSALFLDLDNDGDQDLVLVTNSTLVVFGNDGTRFRSVLKQHIGIATTLAAADYDLDGDLDLYVCGYSPPSGGESAPVPYHDANNGHRNSLLRNDGSWELIDVTAEVGLDADNTRYTLAASWDDFDNDGDPDLYVANDFGRNCLYRNDGGMFVNIAPDAGVEDISAGMGVSWGDFNNDGLIDIYVSNMFSSAGNRVAFQRRFRGGDDAQTLSEFQRHARGNSLFENAGDGTFRDVSEQAGVTMGRWAWSSLQTDINNDGLRDILVTNGMATNPDTGDL